MSDRVDKAAAKAKAVADALEETATDAAGKAAAKAKVVAEVLEETATEAAETLEEGAKGALTRLERGVAKANRALAAPEGADLAPLLVATDLPELATSGALGSLGTRLDREADLYRNVALRELGRVAWIDRVTLTLIVVAFLGEGAIATTATLSALAGAIEGRGGLFALAATILAVAGAGVAALVASSRRMHRALATEAIERSRAIEESLFQLAVVMEWRGTEAPLFQDALARLERRFLRTPE